MPNAWIDALKEYNKGNNSWCVVKKGTPEYDKVKNIMERKKEKKNEIVIHDKRSWAQRQEDMKRAEKSARAESAARRKEASSLVNPSKKGVKEANKHLQGIHEHKMKTDPKYAELKNRPIKDEPPLNATKKKKKKGVLF